MKRYGRIYSVTALPLQDVAATMQRALSANRFRCETRGTTDHPEGLCILAERTSPWYSLVLGALNQRVFAELVADDKDKVHLRLDRRWFRWYLGLMVLLTVLAGAAWLIGFSGILHALDVPGSLSIEVLIWPWFGVLLMFFLFRAVASGTDSVRLIGSLKKELALRGGLLDSHPAASPDRQRRLLALLLGYVFVLSIIAVGGANWRDTKFESTEIPILMLIVGALIVILVAGIIALIVASKQRGADQRFAAIACGLLTMTSMLFPLTSQLSFRLLGNTDHEIWHLVFEAKERLAAGAYPTTLEDGTVVEAANVRKGLSMFRLFLGLLFSLAGILNVIGLFFLLKSVRGAEVLFESCRSIGAEITSATGRAAASGGEFLRNFRVLFGLIWVLTSFLIFFGIAALWDAWIRGALVDSAAGDVKSAVGVVLGTTYAIEFMLGLPIESQWVLRVIQFAWGAAALAVPGAMLFAVVSLLRRRCRLTKQYEAKPLACDSIEPAGLLATLTGMDVLDNPMLVIAPSLEPTACAYEFGIRRRKQIIEVSQGLVNLLDPAELKAVLAHELAHIVCGHARRHWFLQLAGRLTFVGDSFVGALEDSFGYELEADRVAVKRFGVQADDLRRAMLKMQIALTVGSLDPEERVHDERPRQGALRAWRRSVEVWMRLWQGCSPVSYWHPALRERLAALRAFAGSGDGM